MEQETLFEKYAIFQHGGKQYQAIEGKTLALETINAEPGSSVTFDDVLLYKDKNVVEIGQPRVAGATVEATIIKDVKDEKVIIFKFKRRKKSRVKSGHRQEKTVVRIELLKKI